MSIQHILFDADGLILKDVPKFSEIYAKRVDLPISVFNKFFENKFILRETGKADLKQELLPYLTEWKWSGTIDEFVEEWFTTTTFIDERFLPIISDLKNKGVKCHLATNQEKYRGDYIRSLINTDKVFERCFYSYEVGYMKSQPQFFQYVINKLESEPQAIALWDDGKKNIETAKGLGIQAYFYKNFEQFKQQLNDIINL